MGLGFEGRGLTSALPQREEAAGSVIGGLSLRSQGSRRSLASYCREEAVPIDHTVARPCKCGFCRTSSSDPSPIGDPDNEDDRIPRGKYLKVEAVSSAVRAPAGTH